VCLSIPTNPHFGSLNLAAAVQLVAYDWRLAVDQWVVDTPAPQNQVLADSQTVQAMLNHVEQALVAISFLDPHAPKKLMPRLNQLMSRAQPSMEEVHILRGMAKAMLQTAAKATD
jgi:tRNA/rRNA methyltransferase